MTHYVTRLEAALDGTAIPFGSLVGTHAGRPIVVRYDLAHGSRRLSPTQWV